jgi:hypothetical protein
MHWAAASWRPESNWPFSCSGSQNCGTKNRAGGPNPGGDRRPYAVIKAHELAPFAPIGPASHETSTERSEQWR